MKQRHGALPRRTDLADHGYVRGTITLVQEDRFRLEDDPGGRDGRRQQFEALSEQLSWIHATHPLREFARQPALSRDRQNRQVSRLLSMALKGSRRGLWLMHAARVSYATGGTRGVLRDLARLSGKQV